MPLSELATMDTAELEIRLVESRKELFNLRFQLATGQLDNTARIGHIKKEVARILTYLRQRDVELTEAEYASALAADALVQAERAEAQRTAADAGGPEGDDADRGDDEDSEEEA